MHQQLPAKMKAVYLTGHGGLEALQYREDVALPSAGPDDTDSIRNRKSDGITNTLFFDGHAAGVPSRTYMVGAYEILYGFPGTVNPAQVNPPPSSVIWDGIWR